MSDALLILAVFAACGLALPFTMLIVIRRSIQNKRRKMEDRRRQHFY